MSLILTNKQAQAVQAFIDSGAQDFAIHWPTECAVVMCSGALLVRSKALGEREVYRTFAEFTAAYSFLL